MLAPLVVAPRQVFAWRWRPNLDLAAVGLSYLLVTGALYTATMVVGPQAYGGLAYFAIYGLLTATLFGLGLPLYWTAVVRHRSPAELGLTRRHLGKSLLLQTALAAGLYFSAFSSVVVPAFDKLVPLVALALTIGFFEAIFWRGWVLARLEECFGFLPAVLLGSALYAAYHVGYGMPLEEMAFLFFVGVLFAVTFRLTNSVFILWPAFQPLGQLLTLTRDGLDLPLLAALGFAEVLLVMLALVWLAFRYHRRHGSDRAPVLKTAGAR